MDNNTQDGRGKFRFRLDGRSGVPVYRQLIDQVHTAISTGVLRPADQLPTVRQVAVELTINPNTVLRAYREMEIRGVLETQQGTGTFVAVWQPEATETERAERLRKIVSEFVAQAGAAGLTVDELMKALKEMRGKAG